MARSSSCSEGSYTPLFFSPQEPGDHRRPCAKKRKNGTLSLFFSIFCPSKLQSKFCIEKTSKKVWKSMVLASQTPPKTRSKSFENRRSKKHAIFHWFLFDFCCLLQEPTSISYWFLQYKMALGRFSSSCFLHGFGVQKTYQKPLKNDVRTLTKSIPKTFCFSTSIFSGFGLDFGGSWASKMEPSWLL